jgi:hypothetical protein
MPIDSKRRTTEIKMQLFEMLQTIQENDIPTARMPPTQQSAIANSNPPQPLPGQNAIQQPVGSSGGQPMSVNGEPLTVDVIIEKLDNIRGGKSLSDSEVYGKMTTLYNALSDQDKANLDNFLGQISEIVLQPQQKTSAASQMQGIPPTLPPSQVQQPAQPAQSAPAPTPNVATTMGTPPANMQ